MSRTPRWRPMNEGDLDAVAAIDAASGRGTAEERAVFADRLALFPAGCFASERDGALLGYAIAYPWRAGSPPPLFTCLGALPPDGDCMFLHDVVLLPPMRGQGAGGEIVRAYVALTAARALPAIELVALDGTHDFWRHQGFSPVQAAAAKLSTYGTGAVLMRRAVGAR